MNIFIFLTSLLISIKDSTFNKEPIVKSNQTIVKQVSAFEDLKEPLYFEPKILILNFSSEENKKINVEEVGLDSSHQLETPRSWQNAGWYTKSVKPGEKGNVVIDGHYDTNTGLPAAFWALKYIKVNDKVILKDKLNRSFEYEVIDTHYVDIKDPKRLQVFEKSNNPTLTLITCGGVWDYKDNTYNKRLVIKAKLVSSDLD